MLLPAAAEIKNMSKTIMSQKFVLDVFNVDSQISESDY